MDNDIYLQHHGVKGMHWGIRRSPEQLGKKVRKLEKKNEKLNDRVGERLYKRDKVEAKAFRAKSKALRKGSRRAEKKAKKQTGKLMTLDSTIYKMRYKIAANGEKIDSFQKTIKSLDGGEITRGRGFVMRYVDGNYVTPKRIGSEDTSWLIKY